MTQSSSSQQARFWAVVPAAGSGQRMHSEVPKQYLSLGERTVLEQTLDTLLACPRIASVTLVLAADDDRWPGLAPRYAGTGLQTVDGGAERYQSVLNGLQQLAQQARADDWVLVHDAARPCVRIEDINALMTQLQDGDQGGLLGVPVADTMKRVAADHAIEETVDREGLWHAYTPQMFRLGMLTAALQQAIERRLPVTDEASAMEHAGYRPRMVAGARDNIKITRPEDLALARFYLQSRAQP